MRSGEGEWEMRNAEWGGGMGNAECGVRNAEWGRRKCGMGSAEWGRRNAECGKAKIGVERNGEMRSLFSSFESSKPWRRVMRAVSGGWHGMRPPSE
jgi:hypothetical protein